MRGLFPHFPVFIDVMGRPAALLGGDATMAEIAQRLLDSGAGVAVFDPAPGVEISALEGHVRLHRRRWRAADLRGAALVIAAAGEPRPQRARLAAKGAQAIFCQIGAAAQSDIALGAVVLRGPLAIGVAAHGLAPELEAAMRGRLEAALPAGLAEFFAAAAAARETVEATLPAGAARAQFWTHLAGAAEHAAPRDWRAWIEAALDNAESARASD